MDVLSRLGCYIFYAFQWFITLGYSLVFDNEKTERLPTFDDKLLTISATKLADKIRRQEISSEDVVKAYIKRIKAVNPIINAVVEDRFAAAVQEAKEIDNHLERSQFKDQLDEIAKNKPLLGVPITIKECIGVKGMSFTGCSLTRKGMKASDDADVVRLVKQSGAVILLVSNTPEYCNSLESYNKLIGRTRNPYNSRCTSGGSSGGEGALLGAGASLIGVGSDVAGSIRYPCAWNGIFGHKPTAGITPLGGTFPTSTDQRFSDYLVMGPMTRYVEDLKPLLKVLAGNNVKKLNLDSKVDLQQLKIFYMEHSYSEFGLTKVDKQIQNAIKEAATYLTKSFKCELDETKFNIFDHCFEASSALIFTLDDAPSALTGSKVKYSYPVELLKYLVGQSIFTPQTLFFTALSKINFGTPKAKIQEYLKIVEDDKKFLQEALGDNGVLLFPSICSTAFEHYGYIGGMPDVRFNGIVNIYGFPSTCVPARLSKNGLPIGFQIIAAPYNDHLCLAVANELSTYFGGWQPPC